MRVFLLVLFAMILSSCASGPLVIDVSDSIYKPSKDVSGSGKNFNKIEIINTADDGDIIRSGLGGKAIYPLWPATRTKKTLEDDLRRFFSDVAIIDKSSSRSIIITISKADSYWVMGGVAGVPIVGLAFVGADSEFGMNVRVLIEVEEGGKVTASYHFDEKIRIMGKATTGDAIKDSYRVLISEYRKRLYGELESRFLNRYL
jgi:hypothetical protein